MASKLLEEVESKGRSIAVTQIIATFAVALSILISVAPPFVYYFAMHLKVSASTEAKAESISGAVTELVAATPDAWMHRHQNLLQLLQPVDGVLHGEQQRIVRSAHGDVLAETSTSISGSPAWPRLTVTVPIYDQGDAAGEVSVVTSTREQALAALGVAGISVLTGALCFIFLRTVPLRLLGRATSRAAWLASHDPLTGLANRTLFAEKLKEALQRARRDGSTVAVICLDLDRFKEVNDTLGHAAGDNLLAQVGQRILANIRETDALARLGGDEFAIVQTQAQQPDNAEALARRLSQVLAEPFQLDGHQVVIGSSLGIALTEAGKSQGPRLMQEADLAMYQAKANGRGGHQLDASGNLWRRRSERVSVGWR